MEAEVRLRPSMGRKAGGEGSWKGLGMMFGARTHRCVRTGERGCTGKVGQEPFFPWEQTEGAPGVLGSREGGHSSFGGAS